ncbi:sirohydrochlorin cobaltochelatase [uncultured Desulfovibrio sp.]|uniref:sirohydrochlorin cobaltochelatase n=1 Tax=uncultured Desulfovibrio sp. TaxID=167968 RepID=UPI002626FEE4|nr:sirohydrochlorin cobaltochelatase [uncultured Desulfovibrio sp.]
MKRAILLVAFGASGLRAQEALRGFDVRVRLAHPGVPVRWAYTSLLLRERLAQARQKSDSVAKALLRLQFERFTHVAVQPLQTIPGGEHAEVRGVVDDVAQATGMVLRLGTPLLNSDDDVLAAARAVCAHVPAERLPHEDVLLMGHGAQHAAVSRYEDLARAVYALDPRIHVGAMCGSRELGHLLPRLTSSRVWLMPLLSVIGRHALEDMAGQRESSWRSRLEAAGHHCCPVLHGMAEYAGFADIWLRHLDQAVAGLDAPA